MGDLGGRSGRSGRRRLWMGRGVFGPGPVNVKNGGGGNLRRAEIATTPSAIRRILSGGGLGERLAASMFRQLCPVNPTPQSCQIRLPLHLVLVLVLVLDSARRIDHEQEHEHDYENATGKYPPGSEV